jgi:ferritin
MISKAMQSALNDQIQAELFSAYYYLSISAWCEAENLPGHGAWMRKQSAEEVGHAMRFYTYIVDRSGKVELEALGAPPAKFKSPLDVWQKVLANEQQVTVRIHALCDKAAKANDRATLEMLQWFVKEQVEEEKSVSTILEQVKMIGGGASLFFLDRHLAKDAAAKE